MIKYKKIYCKAFGYPMHKDTFIPSELSQAPAVDIHHIIGRGRGGEDRIENLIALTRQEHIDFGDKNKLVSLLLIAHRKFLINRGVEFDNEWFNKYIEKYT